MPKPLAIELFAGLFGWSEGLCAEGFEVIGFDVVDMHAELGVPRKPEHQLVLQDVLTLHGKQFKDAALIVASPPCQEYSYMAMPWSRAKAIAAEYRSGARDLKKLTALFDACFRIQREACEAAGRHKPLIVENVRGAIPWVGRSRANYGSFHLWGDVPALMPMTKKYVKVPGVDWHNYGKPGYTHPSFRDNIKNNGGSWFNVGSPGQKETNRNPVHDGIKNGNDWFGAGDDCSLRRRSASKSSARKAASAQIAKIPYPLAVYIASVFHPQKAAA